MGATPQFLERARFGSFLIPVVALVCLLGAPTEAVGQSATCENAQSTAAMRYCEIERLKRANEAMESAYRRLLSKVDAQGQAKLEAAQEAWLKYRAAEAKYQADTARDGTLAPLIKAAVQADMTEARARELENAIKQAGWSGSAEDPCCEESAGPGVSLAVDDTEDHDHGQF